MGALMAGFEYPSNSPVVDGQGNATPPWANTFNRWHTIIASAQQSGPTAARPDSLLWIGRRFFDTTLGKPVYLKSVKPSVWVDGAGVVS
jgi:hypothetical protein